MKKTLLSFALLLIGVGAWAQTAIDPSKYYTLQCYATDHGGNYIAEVDGEIKGREENPTYFVFEAGTVQGTYYIKSYLSGKYINSNANFNDVTFDEEKKTAWTKTALSGNIAFAAADGKYLNNNETGEGVNGLKVAGGTGGCSQWKLKQYIKDGENIVEEIEELVDVTADVKTPINYIVEATRPAYSNPHLYLKDGKVVLCQPERYGPADTNGTIEDGSFLFYFTKASQGKYYIHLYEANSNFVLGVAEAAHKAELELVDKTNTGGKTAIEWTLEEVDGTKVAFKTNIGGADYIFCDGGGRPSNAVLETVPETTLGNGYKFTLIKPESPKVDITELKYATFYAPVAVQIPEGLDAYYVSATTEQSASMTAIEDVIPAKTGVVLYSETAKSYEFVVAATVPAIESNKLLGTTADKYIEGNAYVLASVEGKVGFYKAKLNKDGSGAEGATHFKNNAGKAYLPVAASEARFISFDFGTETAIEGVESVENNAVVYDLAGRRVQGVQKGIFIVNGKKVVK